MALILVVGPDSALLEGVSQTLVGAGHKVSVARDVREGLEGLRGLRPLVAVIHRDQLLSGGTAFQIPLAHGGCLLGFHSDETDAEPLPFRVQRVTLAHLSLPLERKRLLTLVRFVETRAHTAGREGSDEELEAPASP